MSASQREAGRGVGQPSAEAPPVAASGSHPGGGGREAGGGVQRWTHRSAGPEPHPGHGVALCQTRCCPRPPPSPAAPSRPGAAAEVWCVNYF